MSFVELLSTFLLLASIGCGMFRLSLGPSTLDRILAFDYICVCIISLITLHSIRLNITLYLELILIFSLLGFATVVSLMEMFFALSRNKEERL